jgi:Tol biopolymer transport system component
MNPLNHTQVRRYIQAAADNRLESRERSALDEHLATCTECRSYADQNGLLESNLRALFHKQWDTASERNINLLPGVRAHYNQKMARNQILSLANTLVTIGLVVGLLLLLNWFLSTHQAGRPAGNLTPTPTVTLPTPASPTPAITQNLPTQTVEFPLTVRTPTGSLAFISSTEELADLYLVNADGSGQIKLFDDNLSLSLFPAWSPDGFKLAFVSNRDSNSEIYLINTDGTQTVRLTENLVADTHPAWSPDGKHIAFASDRSGYSEIYTMDTNGSNVTRLTHTQASNTHPTWSPDGAFIAFSTNRDGYWQIYRMNADGSEPINLSNNPMSDDREPTWSPDGRWIAFASQQVKTRVQHIYVMNADGSRRLQLTGNTSSTDQTASDFSPAWSPDSQWIAFCSYRDNLVYGDIYIIPAGEAVGEATSIIRLTTQGASYPSWKP